MLSLSKHGIEARKKELSENACFFKRELYLGFLKSPL